MGRPYLNAVLLADRRAHGRDIVAGDGESARQLCSPLPAGSPLCFALDAKSIALMLYAGLLLQ